MFVLFGWLIVLAALISVRSWLLRRPQPQRRREPLDSVVYRVGTAAIVERTSVAPQTTVLCMHGYLEDVLYFVDYYSDPNIQLLLVQSGGYHLPIENPRYESADWAKAPSAHEGTIEYDAEVLVQALEHLPRTNSIRVHGHSRGGAVVLEAAAMRPDLFRSAEVILEAPVLPQAKPKTSVNPLVIWFSPFVAALWRLQPINSVTVHRWGSLENSRKRQVIKRLPYSVRTSMISTANLRSIERWRKARTVDIYRHVTRGVILVPSNDEILDPISMRDSAQQAQGTMRAVWVSGCSHFVLYDRPEILPPLLPGKREEAV